MRMLVDNVGNAWIMLYSYAVSVCARVRMRGGGGGGGGGGRGGGGGPCLPEKLVVISPKDHSGYWVGWGV